MKLYIDPGTGSMLFAILIGILGAANYLLKDWIVKIRFLLSGGRQKADVNEKKIPIVIFSDDKRYWTVFEPLCREFDRRGVDIVYMTASPDDPALKNPYEHIKGEFIGENNKAFAKLNFLNATLVLSTTPGLDVYQWKRSKKVQYYVHMLHAANEIAGYRMFGTDYYDALLLSGEYQVRDVRYLERIRNLPVKIGIPYLDEMYARLHKAQNADIKSGKKERTVLLAPSWGKSAILSKFGERIIDVLIETGYSIIIRPHPQSFTSEREMLDTLMEKYPNSEKLEWNRDNDNFEVLKRADILISDFSGVVFDFSLVHEKPVIYTDTKFDKGPYDAWWLKTPYWTFTALPRIGQELNEENLDSLKEMIDSCLSDEKYAQGRQEVIRETWEHRGEGTQRAVDYILSKYEQLKSAEEEK